jgi:glucose/mannose-6-phosphate isomerase
MVLLGYGTSSTVARLISAVAGVAATVPIVSVPGPGLPGWVGPMDLVVVASTTGRAPEIVTALTEAGRRGCRIIAVTPASSPVGQVCRQVRGALVDMTDEVAPVWARLWSVAVPVLIVAESIGVIPPQPYEAAACAAEEMAIRCRPSQEAFVNPAKEIALRFAETTPVVWASGQVAAVAAERLADQAALRGGRISAHAALPDLGRGQLGLLDSPASAPRDLFYDPEEDGEDGGAPSAGLRPAVILLSEDGADPRLSVVTSLIEERDIPSTLIVAQEPEPLARAAGLIALADFAAAYLALVIGAGPDQGHAIDQYRVRTAQ